MTSPYLRRPVRTLEQALAERLRRPVPVGSRPKPKPATSPAADEAPPAIAIAKSAEGGD